MEYARQHLEIGVSAGVGEAPIAFNTQFANTLWYQGRLHEVGPIMRAQYETSPSNVNSPLALVLAYLEHDEDEAASELLGSLPRPAHYRSDFQYLGSLALAAETCFLTTDRTLAAELYALARQYPGLMCDFGGTGIIGNTTAVSALVATVLERWDEAEQRFVEAIEQLEGMEIPVLLARVRWEFAEMLVRRDAPGDRERAITLAQQAHDFAASCGMAFVERKSADLLASLAP
jgi:hypothetical protein